MVSDKNSNQAAAHPRPRGCNHLGSPRLTQAHATITRVARRGVSPGHIFVILARLYAHEFGELICLHHGSHIDIIQSNVSDVDVC